MFSMALFGPPQKTLAFTSRLIQVGVPGGRSTCGCWKSQKSMGFAGTSLEQRLETIIKKTVWFISNGSFFC